MPCDRFCNKLILLLALLYSASTLFAMVPPVPKYKNIPAAWQQTRIEGSVFSAMKGTESQKELPDSILVLRVQFSNKSFKTEAQYPDYLPHDDVFFNRWMLHLQDFFVDASHGAYKLHYSLYPQVLTLPNTMAYYGEDSSEKIDQRLPQMLPDIMSFVDAELDFSRYGGVVIFHAGAGQESDIDSVRPEQIWSTFLTRKNLQAYFDPDNDNYPGFTTNDGAVLNNIVVIPEDEFQDYFPAEDEENASAYLFSIYGVLAHQYGHLIGLPTLFDNDSSNGKSQGIGNWGLMGTGVWNGNGFVPAQLSAYSRYLLGWENPVVISQDSPLNNISHFLNHQPGAIRLYKIPISATEYFLVENRQQNPDGSLDPYTSQPSYSFNLLPDGEQDYYDNYPLLPYFNFMENSYLGSEWDFFLPGLGGPLPDNSSMLQDGSGLLIWHIDENIIAANFTSNFDLNRINADSHHKGVDLEEADGIQHLDTAIYDIYKWGSPFDSFRSGNNSFFGGQYHNGLLSLPTSESYYGGIPLEIHDISVSGNQMTFGISFRWRRDTAYLGKNSVNAAALDFDDDGQDELFYPMPNGQLYMWDNEELMEGYPLLRMPVVQPYTWDGEALYIPMQQNDLCRLYMLSSTERQYVFTSSYANWASHPVDLGDTIVMPFLTIVPPGEDVLPTTNLVLYDKSSGQSSELFSLNGPLVGNLVHFRNHLYTLHYDMTSKLRYTDYDLESGESVSGILAIPRDSTVVAIFKAPLVPGSVNGELIVQCTNSVYAFDAELNLIEGFPYVHNLVAVSDSSSIAPLSLADVDGNGSLDILIGGERGFAVIDYSAKQMSPQSLNLDNTTEGISGGLYAADLDGDGKAELFGNFAQNRMNVWEHDYRSKSGFPVAFAERSRNMPFLSLSMQNKWHLYSAADNGTLFRTELPNTPLPNPAFSWLSEYADLSRSASIDPDNLPNQYQSSSIFVPNQVFIYPNPLKSIYLQKLILNVMPSEDCEVELSIFDISGSMVYRQKGIAKAYLKNLELFDIPAAKLSSGVYIAVVKSPRDTIRLKFAVEK